jgi:hypothetical protein
VRRPPLLLAALGALGALALGSCGGDDKLSKAELAKQANAICIDSEKRLRAVPQPAAGDANKALEYYDKTAPLIAVAVTKLKALKPEDDVKRDWETYTSKQESATKLLGDLTRQVRARDPTARQTLAQIAALTRDSNAAAEKVGATSCAARSG